ncbi:aldo/keto reductase [Rhizobium mesoamericanum]|uniref:aldo/keto reductase n=1 Tax=Rhizobium mesoamericanum TaxID=1079800 RepID=UPI0004286AF0|nr:aldo/keto reductase [Rhizobium mesoamericanum]
MNLFDTADAYAGGQSEELLRAALKARRSEAVITTKVGFRSGSPITQAGLSRRHVMWSVDQSLKRLGTDWIDVYVVHKEDPFTQLEETLQALDDIVRAGKVRYLGFSNWSAWKVASALELQKANGWAKFTYGQVNYSLLGRHVERDVIPMMKHFGLGMTVWSPLAAGFLSGKYTRESLQDSDNRLSGFDILPTNKELGFKLVEDMRVIADRHGASVAQVAIAWLLSKKAVTSVLLGSSKLSQLNDNLKAANVHLDPEELSALDQATALAPVYPNWFVDGLVDQPTVEALAAKT